MGQLSHLIYSNVLTATDELHITGTADVITTSENADENTSMIAGHPVTIDGNAKVTGYASSIGIDSSAGSADYSVKITDQANVTINAAYNYSREAIAASGSIIISGNAIVDCETFCAVEPEYGHPPHSMQTYPILKAKVFSSRTLQRSLQTVMVTHSIHGATSSFRAVPSQPLPKTVPGASGRKKTFRSQVTTPFCVPPAQWALAQLVM